MNLGTLRLAEGISITIHVGELPPDVTPVSDGGAIPEIPDAVVVVLKYRGEFVLSMATRRADWDRTADIDNDLIQEAIDRAVAKFPGPRLVE